MATIKFFDEDAKFLPENRASINDWVEEIVNSEGKALGTVNFIFCSDEYLHQINITYLGHNTYTDIITFDNSDNSENIEGDVFISIPRVKENANLFNTSFNNELHRVIIHGILHLLGYKDKTPIQKSRMREKENECLKQGPVE